MGQGIRSRDSGFRTGLVACMVSSEMPAVYLLVSFSNVSLDRMPLWVSRTAELRAALGFGT